MKCPCVDLRVAGKILALVIYALASKNEMGNPPGNDMWMTYTVNKEDVWVESYSCTNQYAVKGIVSVTLML